MSSYKSSWVTKASKNKKPWGDETSWSGGYASTVKTLFLLKGKRNSFKINKTKDEMLICGSGKIKAYFGNEELTTLGVGEIKCETLLPGNALVVQSGCPYRLEAVENSVILEISSNSNSDIIRLHDDYGRATVSVNSKLDKIIKDLWS